MNCITHHHACACREAKLKDVLRGIAKSLPTQAFVDLNEFWIEQYGCDIISNEVNVKYCFQEKQKLQNNDYLTYLMRWCETERKSRFATADIYENNSNYGMAQESASIAKGIGIVINKLLDDDGKIPKDA